MSDLDFLVKLLKATKATKNVRGVARIFTWGGPKNRFRISVNVIWESTHSPSPPPRGSGYFPKLP